MEVFYITAEYVHIRLNYTDICSLIVCPPKRVHCKSSTTETANQNRLNYSDLINLILCKTINFYLLKALSFQ